LADAPIAGAVTRAPRGCFSLAWGPSDAIPGAVSMPPGLVPGRDPVAGMLGVPLRDVVRFDLHRFRGLPAGTTPGAACAAPCPYPVTR
jgi:hypothetical protein